MFLGKLFRGRRRWRWWQRRAENRKHLGLLAKVRNWTNRKQFYTFHKDEIITHADTCPSPTLVEKLGYEEESEWNNESESEDDADNVRNFEYIKDWTYQPQTPSESDLETDEGEMLETIHEEASLEASPPRVPQQSITLPSPSSRHPVSRPSSPKLFQRNGAVESASESLESIDSLVSSHWDAEDDGSALTPLATNVLQPNDAFFVEHVRFLQVQTQPRKVEEVYHNEDEGA